jgi:hypothetical protein
MAERRKKLLDRVAKLLAQAAGTPYPQEAQTAYTMAQKLMLENGISAAEVDALPRSEQEALVADEVIDQPTTYYLEWALDLAEVVAENFRCKALWRMRTRRSDGVKVPTILRFVGLIDDVVVARDVYRSVTQEAPRLAKEYSHAPGCVETYLANLYDLDPSLPHPWAFDAADRRWAHRELQTSFLKRFLEGLEVQFREQVDADPSLALLLTVHPVVQARYADRPTFEYEPPPGTAIGDDEAAGRAGFEAGRRFKAEPTRQLGPGTPRLPEQG